MNRAAAQNTNDKQKSSEAQTSRSKGERQEAKHKSEKTKIETSRVEETRHGHSPAFIDLPCALSRTAHERHERISMWQPQGLRPPNPILTFYFAYELKNS